MIGWIGWRDFDLSCPHCGANVTVELYFDTSRKKTLCLASEEICFCETCKKRITKKYLKSIIL